MAVIKVEKGSYYAIDSAVCQFDKAEQLDSYINGLALHAPGIAYVGRVGDLSFMPSVNDIAEL